VGLEKTGGTVPACTLNAPDCGAVQVVVVAKVPFIADPETVAVTTLGQPTGEP